MLFNKKLRLQDTITISPAADKEGCNSMVHEILLAHCTRVTLVIMISVYYRLHLLATNGKQIIALHANLYITDVYNNGVTTDPRSLTVYASGMKHFLKIPIISKIKLI